MKNLKTILPLILLFLMACKKDVFDHDPNSAFQANMQKLADAYVEEGLPGMVLLIDHPQHGFHLIESGVANKETQRKLKKDHLFHSASLMKMYTAVCIFQLEEKELLKTSDLISQHLKETVIEKIPNGEKAKINDLLNHSSGTPDFAAQANYLDDLLAFTEGGIPPQDELEYIKNLSPDFEPGSNYQYSNTGSYILQLIVAEISGQAFEHYFHENVIQKLDLKNTFYKNLPTAVDYDRVPNYYIDWDGNGELSNSTNLENLATQTFEGFSGLLATVEDYHSFIKALFSDGSLLSEASIQKMKAVTHTNGFGYGQGLEVILSNDFPDKYGHKGGTQSSFFFYPSENTFVLSMLNYSFNTGNSPFDKKAIVPDEIGVNKNLIGEIEICLFQ